METPSALFLLPLHKASFGQITRIFPDKTPKIISSFWQRTQITIDNFSKVMESIIQENYKMTYKVWRREYVVKKKAYFWNYNFILYHFKIAGFITNDIFGTNFL